MSDLLAELYDALEAIRTGNVVSILVKGEYSDLCTLFGLASRVDLRTMGLLREAFNTGLNWSYCKTGSMPMVKLVTAICNTKDLVVEDVVDGRLSISISRLCRRGSNY